MVMQTVISIHHEIFFLVLFSPLPDIDEDCLEFTMILS